MKLINIYSLGEDHGKVAVFLYEMLRTRDPAVNISHRKMPTFNQHLQFIRSAPYAAWYIISDNESWVGNCYLTRQNEIGIHLVPDAQRNGIGKLVVREMMARHGNHRYLANISPNNPGSIDFFKGLGFKLIQYTFELDTCSKPE